jgi:uncharacterized membrane protein
MTAPALLPDRSNRPARRPEVDAVRGLVMIVMALDHVRDFLGNAHFDATDLARTTAPVFFSRWITHVCAPTFFLLAGMSAYLSIQSGRRTVAAAARFLVVRGLALVVQRARVTLLSNFQSGARPRCRTPEPDCGHEVWGWTLVNAGLPCMMIM